MLVPQVGEPLGGGGFLTRQRGEELLIQEGLGRPRPVRPPVAAVHLAQDCVERIGHQPWRVLLEEFRRMLAIVGRRIGDDLGQRGLLRVERQRIANGGSRRTADGAVERFKRRGTQPAGVDHSSQRQIERIARKDRRVVGRRVAAASHSQRPELDRVESQLRGPLVQPLGAVGVGRAAAKIFPTAARLDPLGKAGRMDLQRQPLDAELLLEPRNLCAVERSRCRVRGCHVPARGKRKETTSVYRAEIPSTIAYRNLPLEVASCHPRRTYEPGQAGDSIFSYSGRDDAVNWWRDLSL